MENKLFENIQDLVPLALPFLLLFLVSKGEGLKRLDIKLDENYYDKANMVQNIKPYFSVKDQRVLGKVQDVFEILDNVNRIIKSDYNSQIRVLNQDMSLIDKTEKVLAELAKHMDGNKKQVAETIVNTKNNLFKAKDNFEEYSQAVSTQKLDNITSMLKLANCIEPLIGEKDKRNIRKLEEIANIIKSPN